MKSLAIIFFASGFPLLLSSQKAQYPDCNIHKATKCLKQSFEESGYSDVYYNYILEDDIEGSIGSLSRVYAYYFSVLSLKPEVKDAIIAYYESDKNKVIKLIY